MRIASYLHLAAVAYLVIAAHAGIQTVKFSQPASLVALYPNGVSNSPALFGVPPYGFQVTGKLVYSVPGNRDACQAINTSLAAGSWPAQGEPFIALVDRGGCSFCTKVRNAQNAGAYAVIVANDRDESELPNMADDGSGATITVPSVLVSKNDGNNIKGAFAEGDVISTFRWGTPNPDATVEWSLWTSSWEPETVQFKTVFGVAAEALKDRAEFTPHYSFVDGLIYGCDGNSGTACGNQCTNGGRYCAVDPEGNSTIGLTGADVVTENLRQMCIWNLASAAQSPLKWWGYVKCFQKNCTEKTDMSLACSQVCQQAHDIPSTSVDECIANSGGSDVNGGSNSLIAAEMNLKAQSEVFLMPTVFVNNAKFYGSMSCPAPITRSGCAVFDDICSGYAEGSTPIACTGNNGCPLGEFRTLCGHCSGDPAYGPCGDE